MKILKGSGSTKDRSTCYNTGIMLCNLIVTLTNDFNGDRVITPFSPHYNQYRPIGPPISLTLQSRSLQFPIHYPEGWGLNKNAKRPNALT